MFLAFLILQFYIYIFLYCNRYCLYPAFQNSVYNSAQSICQGYPNCLEYSLCNMFVSTVVRAASNMVEVFVDGKPVEVEPGTTVLQV